MGNSLVAQVHRRPLAALLLICVLAWLPGFFTLPPLDRDESRFAQATKQMLESGDYININLGDGPRYEKPVGIYWLQAASTAMFGSGLRNQIWTYRIPSLLGALAAVAATFFIVRLFAGVETAFTAGLLLGMSVLLMSEAKIAKTDAALAGCITVAQAVLMRVYLSVRTPDTVTPPVKAFLMLGWAAFALGILMKGPVVVLVCGASIIAVSLADRDWRWLSRLHALAGFGLAVLIIAPWAIAIGIVSGGQFYQTSLGGDFATKLIGEQETHGGPYGYYAMLAHLTFWPGSLALLPGIVLGVMRWREPAIRYLLLWAATAWLMFEIAPTKLPHYVLPAYPAIAALSAVWLTDAAASSGALRIAAGISLALFVLVGAALGGFVAWAPEQYGSGGTIALYLAAGIGVAAALAALAPAMKGQRLAATGMACVSAAVLYYAAGLLSVPRLDQLWLSPRLADSIARHAMPEDPPVVTAGYAEPSISFLLGTRTALETGAGAALIAGKTGGLVLVDSGENDTFLKLIAEAGGKAEALDEISGLNYSRGRPTRITLYRVVPSAP
jgi:4-amino-4-deoxy-L-arabinose transferase-like glycosyltransferase